MNNPIKKIISNKSWIAFILIGIVCVFAVFINYNKTVFLSLNRKIPIYCVDTGEKKDIAISFDASWGADNTIKILDTLDKYHIKATFFLVGIWVDHYPDMVKEISKRGNEIGNHSNKHPDMTKVSKDRMLQEISVNDAKIAAITGTIPKLFRCPGGAYNNSVIEAVESTGHYCIQWDVDSIDWKGQGADLEYNRIIKKTKPGSIILCHNDAKYTPNNLPRIIEKLQSEGYNFVKISDLIYKDNYTIDHAGKQIKK